MGKFYDIEFVVIIYTRYKTNLDVPAPIQITDSKITLLSVCASHVSIFCING